MKWKRLRTGIITLILSGILIAFGVALFSPLPKIDDSKVHPMFRGMTPANFVGVTHLSDGGTAELVFLDSSGNRIELFHPRPLGEESAFQGRLFINSDYSKPGANEVVGYPHTALKVAEIMRAKRRGSSEVAYEVARLSGRMSDWASLLTDRIFK